MSDQVMIDRELLSRLLSRADTTDYQLACASAREILTQPAPADGVEVVAYVTMGGIFHGGSGPELGDIDVELEMGVLESLQARIVTSSDDVHVDLITLAAHKSEVARLRGEVERLDKARDNQFETLCKMSLELDRANALLRSISPHIARAPEVGYLLGVIDAHLAQQAKS